MYSILHIKEPDEVEVKSATFRKVSFPPHFHDSCSIGLVRTGMEVIDCVGFRNTVHAGKVVVFNAGELHANGHHDDDEWSYSSVYVNADLLRFVAAKIGVRSDVPILFENLVEDPVVAGLILAIASDHANVRTEVIHSLVLALLKRHRRTGDPDRFDHPRLAAVVDDVKGLIASDLFRSHSLEELAKLHGLSRFQLHRAFKRHTGLTTSGYRTLLRINKAKRLIHGESPLTDVALECGFFDQSHFIHRFKAFTGVTPSRYRDSITCA